MQKAAFWTSKSHRFFLMFVQVVAAGYIVTVLAPETIVSSPVEPIKQWILSASSQGALVLGLPISEPLWWFGYLVTALTGATYILRWRGKYKHIPPARRVADSVFLLTGVYLLDVWISTVPRYDWEATSWVFPMVALFSVVIAWYDQRAAQRLLAVAGVAVVVECIYAIIYHLWGIHQFYTPHFGLRTRGTLGNPIFLGALTLVGFPLVLHQVTVGKVKYFRMLWLAGCATVLLAAWLTYTRSIWVGLAATYLYSALCWTWDRSRSSLRQWMILMTVVCISIAAFLRTPLSSQDRSSWGRLAIWEVAMLRIVPLHPILGAGAGSYGHLQREYITERLAQFNPYNAEPKNLFLLLLTEHGIIGLAVFLLFILRILQLSLFFSGNATSVEERAAALLLRGVVIGILAAGLFETTVFFRGREASSLAMLAVVACIVASSRVSEYGTISRTEHPVHTGKNAPHHQHALLRVGFVLLAICLLVAVLAASGLWQFTRARGQIDAYRTRAPARPQFTPLTQVAEPMRYALIASEDGNFYQHHGVDWQALHRALRVNIRSLRFKQGGSTLTMQTARYLFVGREKTLSRKLAEILLALEMEKRLSKERILELYLNSVRFGLGAEDIGTACRVYFGKKPGELTLAESAFLAGVLPEPPKGREELTVEKVERCKRRALSRLGYFFAWRYSPRQIERAMGEKIVFVWER